tara:strand:- start:109 stop:1077 length:969 start_codon:yes stop_codon:yes gene_type:complete
MKTIEYFKLTESHTKQHETLRTLRYPKMHLMQSYYSAYYKDRMQDVSFGILYDNKCVGYVACCVFDEKLCLPGGGLEISLLESLEKKDKKSLLLSTLDYIHSIAAEYKCEEIIYSDILKDDALSLLGEFLFQKGVESTLALDMLIDYQNFEEASYRQSLRKSYKSLINWGKKKLDITSINQESLLVEPFQEFKKFHQKISGRKTRSDETWTLQYEMLEKGYGELIIAHYEGKLVAGSLFLDNADKTIYSTGAYERDLFQFGISHYVLYQGIINAYKRGTKSFSLGRFEQNILDPKQANIQFFKKGFAEKLTPVILWRQKLHI